MKIVDVSSLGETVDAINEGFFWGRRLSRTEREEAARWIAGRQGLPGAYRGGALPAPTQKDIENGIRLFTGEKVRTRAGIAHVLGEEACRTLILLSVPLSEVKAALQRATDAMSSCLQKALRSKRWQDRPGEYCCGRCTLAIWRHMAVGGLSDAVPDRWLRDGIRTLNSNRTGDGKWKRYPFYYTLLTLTEIDSASARKEMNYAAPTCEKILRRSPRDDRFDQRRRAVLERVLQKC